MLEVNDVIQGDLGVTNGEVCDKRCLWRMREFGELIGCSWGPVVVSSFNELIVSNEVGYLHKGTLLTASTLLNVDVCTGEAVSLSMDEGDVNAVDVPGNIDFSVQNYCSASGLEGDIGVPKDFDEDVLYAEEPPAVTNTALLM